jgi:hypothetical protein
LKLHPYIPYNISFCKSKNTLTMEAIKFFVKILIN